MRLHMTEDVFSALADPTRRRLMTWLATRPATATELAQRLPISRQAVVKHLSVLDDARLVSHERLGRDVRYRLEGDRLVTAGDWIAAVSARWETRLSRLKRHLEEGEGHA